MIPAVRLDAAASRLAGHGGRAHMTPPIALALADLLLEEADLHRDDTEENANCDVLPHLLAIADLILQGTP